MKKLFILAFLIFSAAPAFAAETVCIRNKSTQPYKININGGDHFYPVSGPGDCVTVATNTGFRFTFYPDITGSGGYVYMMWARFFNPQVGSGGWVGIQAGRNYCNGRTCLIFNGEGSGSTWALIIENEPADQGPAG